MAEQSGSSAPSVDGGSSLFVLGRDENHVRTCIKVQVLFPSAEAALLHLLGLPSESQAVLKIFEIRICRVLVLRDR